jgi:hypothetical protein
VQYGKEDGTFKRDIEVAFGQQLGQHRTTLGIAPEALEDQRRADAMAGEVGQSALLEQGEHHRTLRQAGGGEHQAVEVTAAFDVFLAAEVADDALLDVAVLADGLDQVDVSGIPSFRM